MSICCISRRAPSGDAPPLLLPFLGAEPLPTSVTGGQTLASMVAQSRSSPSAAEHYARQIERDSYELAQTTTSSAAASTATTTTTFDGASDLFVLDAPPRMLLRRNSSAELNVRISQLHGLHVSWRRAPCPVVSV